MVAGAGAVTQDTITTITTNLWRSTGTPDRLARDRVSSHRGFEDRDDFDDAYSAAYSVLQQSQKIRELARDPNNRQEVAKRLEKLDEGMHRVFAEVGEWTNDPKESANKEIENLKRDFGVLGNAVHYLMTDVGVQHRDDDGDGDEPAAPPPKARTPKLAE